MMVLRTRTVAQLVQTLRELVREVPAKPKPEQYRLLRTRETEVELLGMHPRQLEKIRGIGWSRSQIQRRISKMQQWIRATLTHHT